MFSTPVSDISVGGRLAEYCKISTFAWAAEDPCSCIVVWTGHVLLNHSVGRECLANKATQLQTPPVGKNKSREETYLKILMQSPRSLALNISAITPPAFVSGDDPKDPAKNRRIRMEAVFCTPAEPALKKVKAPKVMINRIWRP